MSSPYTPENVECPAQEPDRGRFLFVVPPLTGHVNPAVSVAMELTGRGHTVAWSAARRVRPLLPPDAIVYEVDVELSERLYSAFVENGGHGPVNDFRSSWDDLFLPLARGTLADVEHAVDAFGPSVVVVDQQAIAGSLVARRRSIPWATLSPTLAVGQVPSAFASWLDSRLAELQSEAKLEPLPRADLSPHLVLGFFTPGLLANCRGLPSAVHLVGPALAHRRKLPLERDPFPWEGLDSRRRVLVSLGSIVSQRAGGFYRVLCDALGGLDLQVIVTAPRVPDVEPPANFIVRRSVPFLALLEHVDAVVCHGGQNTVNEALAHGRPLVVSPLALGSGWPVAQRVVESGAGVRVRSVRLRPDELRAAVLEVLENPRYREAARRLAASFEKAGGAAAAADALEQLAGLRQAA